MPADIAARLRDMPSDALRPILGKILETDAQPVEGWSVTEIGRSVGMSTAGIFQVSGRATTAAGEEPWSTVVKVFGQPRINERGFDAMGLERELEVYRSGQVGFQGSRVRPPDCYALETWQDMHFVWLEDLSGAPQAPWLPEYFIPTARDFGQFNGHWSGASLPAWSWLSPDGLRAKYWSPQHAERLSRLDSLRADPLGGLALPEDVFAGLVQLERDGEGLVSKVETTTKCFCHRDCHAKNLFPIPDTGDGITTVAIDWNRAGIEYLGADVGQLLASATKWLELTIEQAYSLVDPVCDAYLAGLAGIGWSGNEDEMRLTYLTCLGLGEASRMTRLIAMAVDRPESRANTERLMLHPMEEIFERWASVLRFCLAQKDRAMQLL